MKSTQYRDTTQEWGWLRILVIREHPHGDVVRALAREGHDVLILAEQARPIRFLDVVRPHAIVLSGPNATDVCRELRRVDCVVAILVLLRGDSVDDRVAALDAGADDCLSSPFSDAELVARVRAASRHTRSLGLSDTVDIAAGSS